MKGIRMKQGSTLFLRATVLALGLMALGLCVLILPAIYNGWAEEYSDAAYLKYPALLILSSTVIPFFIALYQTWKLLNYVDKNKAFSELSVAALRKIKYCALVFSSLYAAFLPVVYYVTQKEDAPGLMVIGLIMTCAPVVIAVFSAVLQKLLQSAINIKSENDLTV
jgi:hypothetical protein